LADETAPTISSTTVAADNSTIDVTFSEAVYNDTGGSGALEASDFTLSISGGTKTLSSATPSSISISGNVYTLGLNLSGTANGSETITVVPSSSTAIYDGDDNAASTTQSNNTVSLNSEDSTAPTISSTTVAADNSTIDVTFSEAVYNDTGGSGALEASDFTLSISGGTKTLSSDTPSSISISGNVYTLGLNLSGTANGSETITVVPSTSTAIYDGADNAASTSQSNNTVSLVDETAPTISSTTVAADNSTIDVTFSEAVYNDTGGSGALEASDFTLSISGGTKTLSSDTPSSISISGNVYTLGLNLSGTANGSETITVVPSSATAIYDGADNAASTSQSNNTVSFNSEDSTGPTMTITSAEVSDGATSKTQLCR
jgi:copper chaperone CopZ